MPFDYLMREIWLRPNRRAIWFGCLPPLILSGLGAWMVFAAADSTGEMRRFAGMALLLVGLALTTMLIIQQRRPRIGYRDKHVLFYLRGGAPIAVPADVVEAFFVGQGPAHLPAGVGQRQQSANLVARLSQRHTEWAQRPVNRALGNWCDGYVTIRGTWCEPLDSEVVRRLNRRLKEVKDKDLANAR